MKSPVNFKNNLELNLPLKLPSADLYLDKIESIPENFIQNSLNDYTELAGSYFNEFSSEKEKVFTLHFVIFIKASNCL